MVLLSSAAGLTGSRGQDSASGGVWMPGRGRETETGSWLLLSPEEAGCEQRHSTLCQVRFKVQIHSDLKKKLDWTYTQNKITSSSAVGLRLDWTWARNKIKSFLAVGRRLDWTGPGCGPRPGTITGKDPPCLRV